MAYPDALVTGVDVTNAFEKFGKFIDKYLDGQRPPNLRYRQIAPGQSLAEVTQPGYVAKSWDERKAHSSDMIMLRARRTVEKRSCRRR